MRSLFGGLLLGCGLLIAGLSGLCTLLVVGGSLANTSTRGVSEFASTIPAVLIFAGIPFVIGLGLFFLGRYLLRSGREEKPGGAEQADTFK